MSTYTRSPSVKQPVVCVAQRSGPLNQRRSLPSPPRRMTPNQVGRLESQEKCMRPCFMPSTSVIMGVTRKATCFCVTAKSWIMPA